MRLFLCLLTCILAIFLNFKILCFNNRNYQFVTYSLILDLNLIQYFKLIYLQYRRWQTRLTLLFTETTKHFFTNKSVFKCELYQSSIVIFPNVLIK